MAERFQYAVVRYVPDVVRDEALNVGVLVRSMDGSAFIGKFLPSTSVVRRLWPDADRRIIGHFERQVSRVASIGQLSIESDGGLTGIGSPTDASFFTRARDAFNGNIQLTAPRGVREESIQRALTWAYRTYVAPDPMGQRPVNYPTIAPSRLRTRLWNAFERRNLVGSGRVLERFVLPGRHSPWTFDLGYQNGSTHVINSLSLTATKSETNLGRALVMRGMVEEVTNSATRGVLGTAVVARPDDPQQAPGAAESVSLLSDAGIEVVAFSDLSSLVARVDREFASV